MGTSLSIYIAIEQAPPLQLSIATGSQDNSILVANVLNDLGVLMDNSFSPFTHCKEATSKAKWMLLMIRRSFTELSTSTVAAFYNALVRYTSHLAKPCCRRRLSGQIQRLATRLVKGFCRLPYEERLRWLGVHYLRRYRLRGDLIQNVFRRIESGSQSSFYSASGTGLER